MPGIEVNVITGEVCETHNDNVAEFSQEELIHQAVYRFEQVTDTFIFAKVNEYNKANATAFGSVHSCAEYRFDLDYTHQPFCDRVWKWNVKVWEAVRSFFLGATAIPTDEEFQSLLDGVEF